MSNILILVPFLSKGGAELSAAKLSVSLSERHRVFIITFFSKGKFDPTYPYKGELLCMDQPSENSNIQKLINFVKRVRFVRKFKREKKIDYAISFLHTTDYVNILSRQKEKCITTIRAFASASIRKDKIVEILTRSAGAYLYNRCNAVVTLNQRLADDMVKSFGVSLSKIRVIPNFYDFEKIKKMAEEPVEDIRVMNAKYFIITTTGRLQNQKAHWHLIRIFSEVIKKIPAARLVIFGDGELKNYLVSLAADLGLRVADKISSPELIVDFENFDIAFMGFLNNPIKYLKHSDLFAFTTLYEGFPNALAEAMSLGLPAISTDCLTGPRELLSTGINLPQTLDTVFEADCGVLMPVFDGEKYDASIPVTNKEKLWVDEIKKIYDAPEWRANMGSKAAKRINNFSEPEVMKLWFDLLEKLN